MEKLAVLTIAIKSESRRSDPITRSDPTFQPNASNAAKSESLMRCIRFVRPSRINKATKTPNSSAPAQCPTVFMSVGSRTLRFANICSCLLLHNTAGLARRRRSSMRERADCGVLAINDKSRQLGANGSYERLLPWNADRTERKASNRISIHGAFSDCSEPDRSPVFHCG